MNVGYGIFQLSTGNKENGDLYQRKKKKKKKKQKKKQQMKASK